MQTSFSTTQEESHYGAFFHFWSHNKWISFVEPISVKLTINLTSSSPTSGIIVVYRQTGVPMSTCQFSFPIDHQSWNFLQNGTKIIVSNTDNGTISKFLLDMDTKTETNTFLSTLLHYSTLARQIDQKPKDLLAWMQPSERSQLNDSSMDETSTTSLDDPSHHQISSSPHLASTNLSFTSSTTFSPGPYAPEPLEQRSKSAISSTTHPDASIGPSTNDLPSIQSGRTILSTDPLKNDLGNESEQNRQNTVEYDLFADLESEMFDERDAFYEIPEEGEHMAEVAAFHDNLNSVLDPPPFELDPYYAVLNEVERQFHRMEEAQQRLWAEEN